MTFFGDAASDAVQADCVRRGGTWYDSTGPGGGGGGGGGPWVTPETPASVPDLTASTLPVLPGGSKWPWWAWMLAGAVAWSVLKGRRRSE